MQVGTLVYSTTQRALENVVGVVSEVSELATDTTIGIKTETSPCWWISAMVTGQDVV